MAVRKVQGKGSVTDIFRNPDEKSRQKKALKEMLQQCEAGYDYYCKATKLAEELSWRKLIVDMVNIKAETVNLLKPLTRSSPRSAPASVEIVLTDALNSPDSDYLSLLTSSPKPDETHTCPISLDLLQIETQSLERMRRALRHVKSRKLLRQLSSKLATMQIVTDKMKLAIELRI